MSEGVITWPPKSPTEVKEYGFMWEGRLEEDEYIMVSTWEGPEGIIVQDYGLDGENPKTTVIWLSGGELKQSYKFMNRISTSEGRILERTATLQIKAR